jgi:hypothetical protein
MKRVARDPRAIGCPGSTLFRFCGTRLTTNAGRRICCLRNSQSLIIAVEALSRKPPNGALQRRKDVVHAARPRSDR